MSSNWYYLDPDNNKDDPKCGLFCARCKRPIKETQGRENFISIELHPVHPWFKIANGTKPIPKHLAALIGEACFEKVKNEYGIQSE